MSKGKITGINWILTPDKFLSLEEAKKLLETARERAEMANSQGHKVPVKASGYNLRLVQKQLGHSSIRTTEVYADVMEPDTQKALEKLYT